MSVFLSRSSTWYHKFSSITDIWCRKMKQHRHTFTHQTNSANEQKNWNAEESGTQIGKAVFHANTLKSSTYTTKKHYWISSYEYTKEMRHALTKKQWKKTSNKFCGIKQNRYDLFIYIWIRQSFRCMCVKKALYRNTHAHIHILTAL